MRVEGHFQVQANEFGQVTMGITVLGSEHWNEPKNGESSELARIFQVSSVYK